MAGIDHGRKARLYWSARLGADSAVGRRGSGWVCSRLGAGSAVPVRWRQEVLV